MTTKDRPIIDSVSYYRHTGVWCYSAWVGGEFDHSEPLDPAEVHTRFDAEAVLRTLFPAAILRRLEDV